jgi:hypothetical protein
MCAGIRRGPIRPATAPLPGAAHLVSRTNNRPARSSLSNWVVCRSQAGAHAPGGPPGGPRTHTVAQAWLLRLPVGSSPTRAGEGSRPHLAPQVNALGYVPSSPSDTQRAPTVGDRGGSRLMGRRQFHPSSRAGCPSMQARLRRRPDGAGDRAPRWTTGGVTRAFAEAVDQVRRPDRGGHHPAPAPDRRCHDRCCWIGAGTCQMPPMDQPTGGASVQSSCCRMPISSRWASRSAGSA